jgi:hypothetical protein
MNIDIIVINIYVWFGHFWNVGVKLCCYVVDGRGRLRMLLSLEEGRQRNTFWRIQTTLIKQHCESNQECMFLSNYKDTVRTLIDCYVSLHFISSILPCHYGNCHIVCAPSVKSTLKWTKRHRETFNAPFVVWSNTSSVGLKQYQRSQSKVKLGGNYKFKWKSNTSDAITSLLKKEIVLPSCLWHVIWILLHKTSAPIYWFNMGKCYLLLLPKLVAVFLAS